MTNALTPIIAAKREHVARQKAAVPLSVLESRLVDAPRGFATALRAAPGFALITEMKRKSPSGGEIRPGFDPANVAREYEAGGAACLSILTDEPYFGGLNADLGAARAACNLPVLRKDFMIDPYQIVESRALGADCILLIVAALDDGVLRELAAETARLGMDALVEIHDRPELDRALTMGATLIGINNRNLKTLKTDLATFETLAPGIPQDCLRIAESGLRTHADLRRMQDAGAQGYLIGESLLRQPDLAAATRALLGEAA